MLTTNYSTRHMYNRHASGHETSLLRSIRHAFVNNEPLSSLPADLEIEFNQELSQTYVTLFQQGQKPLRWGSRRNSLLGSINRSIEKITSNKHFSDFNPGNPETCRIMLEMVTSERPLNYDQLTLVELTENRLEPGIDGLKIRYRGALYYYMPTDAITHNIMSIRQALNFICKRTGIAKDTNNINKRLKTLAREPVQFTLINSIAYISAGEDFLPLYRGYPQPVLSEKEDLRKSLFHSVDWLIDNMKENGQFLYYYDPIKDSEVDFLHPRMQYPTYYNILRHCGGTITLFRAYELDNDKKYLQAAKRSIEFFVTTIREHEYRGRYACYPFFNKKSKLGGAGIGLVALMIYYKLSGDGSYSSYIEGLVQHILSRISDDGEMIGYFIHPGFKNSAEIIDPSDDEKKMLFSFYYPGEALLGLVLYLKYFRDISETDSANIRQSIIKALDFLIFERPEKYRHMFRPLPSDGWLMQAIEAWVLLGGKTKEAYTDFVFNDAEAMIDHMYNEENSPYPDYPGAFFYEYGEHAYPDGARCEGLYAAYSLAAHLGDEERKEKYMSAMLLAAKCLMQTYNSKASSYAHKYPKKSVGSFRFKFTRQWVRVDSVQHTACYFARLLTDDNWR